MNNVNKKSRIQYKIFTFVLFLILLCLREGTTSYAASASIQITSKEDEVVVGDSVAVILTVNSDVNIGDFEAFITYDPDLLEFKSGGAFISGDDGLLKISDVNSEDASVTKKYAMEFEAKKVGVSEIAIQDKAMVYDADEGLEMSVSNNNLYLSINSSKSASTNANLKSLKISPGTLKPEFNTDTTDYTTTVNSDITELIVSGTPEDKNANISVSGATKLSSGKNTVKVKVTAESGDTNEYNIIVTKEEATNKENQVLNEDSNKDNSSQKEGDETFKVVNKDGNIFIENTYRLQVTPVDPDTVVPSGYVKTSLILSGVNVTAYGLEDDLENDFFLIYAMNEDGDKQFYQYDRVEKTMQRYTDSNLANGNKTNADENLIRTTNEYQDRLGELSIIIAILGSICIVLLITVIRLFLKSKGYREDDLD